MKKPADLTLFELLTYATTRIKCKLKDGSTSTGTGFFMPLDPRQQTGGTDRAFLVTNKHVVEGAVSGSLTLAQLSDGVIQPTEHVTIPFNNFENFWIPHPDESIDLCVLNMKPIETLFRGTGREFFFAPLLLSMIPTEGQAARFSVMEEVIMVGYPNGIWDSKNNKPIFRRGVTATDYRLDYEGKSEFIVDMAVFGGSSGSPVVIANDGLFSIEGKAYVDKRVHLLGVLYAGFQHSAQGEITIRPVPRMEGVQVETAIPNNLGIVIKANRLRDFVAIFYGTEETRPT